MVHSIQRRGVRDLVNWWDPEELTQCLRRTDSIIDRLIIYVINRGVLTA